MNCPSAMYLVMFFRPTLSTMRTSLHRQQNLVAFPSPTASSLSSGQILFPRLKIHTRHPSLPTDSHTLAILYFMASMPPQSTRLSFSPGTRRDGLMLAISSDSVHETEVRFALKNNQKLIFFIMFQICCRLQSNGIGLSQSTRIFLKRRISRSNINVHYSTCTDVSINGILRES